MNTAHTQPALGPSGLCIVVPICIHNSETHCALGRIIGSYVCMHLPCRATQPSLFICQLPFSKPPRGVDVR